MNIGFWQKTEYRLRVVAISMTMKIKSGLNETESVVFKLYTCKGCYENSFRNEIMLLLF